MTKNIYCNDFQNKLTLQCSVFFLKINWPGCAVSTLHNRNVSPIHPRLVHIWLNNLYRKRNIWNYFRLKTRVFDNYQAEVWLITLRFIQFNKEEKVSECRHPVHELLTKFCMDKIWNEMHHTLQKFDAFFPKVSYPTCTLFEHHTVNQIKARIVNILQLLFLQNDLLNM